MTASPSLKAYVGADIFDGHRTVSNHALLVDGTAITGICAIGQMPANAAQISLEGGTLVPGYIDLQVNGGGGVQFNDDPSCEAITTICATHARFGTTALLVTLITDTPENTQKAISAASEAVQHKIPGFLGLHLEGPHLSAAKKGAHDANLIRKMTDDDLALLLDAKQKLPVLMVTIAPESVTNDQISKMAKAGIIVSLGHSDATFEQAKSAVDAGVSCVTHLYNAMSPLTHRSPGVVGAALDLENVHCSLIADGYHIAPEALSIALRAKKASSHLFLISDAMATIGTDIQTLTLNGRTIHREGDRLLLEDGTLAGAHLDLHTAVTFMHEKIGLPFEEAVRMATLYPARCVTLENKTGTLKPGAHADFNHISKSGKLISTWIGGAEQHA